MNLLLDTHLLLWATKGFDCLPPAAQQLMIDFENELFFSVASLWEVVIKNNLGRKDFQVDPHLLRRGLLDNGYTELPIYSEHVVMVSSLPVSAKSPVVQGGARPVRL